MTWRNIIYYENNSKHDRIKLDAGYKKRVYGRWFASFSRGIASLNEVWQDISSTAAFRIAMKRLLRLLSLMRLSNLIAIISAKKEDASTIRITSFTTNLRVALNSSFPKQKCFFSRLIHNKHICKNTTFLVNLLQGNSTPHLLLQGCTLSIMRWQ